MARSILRNLGKFRKKRVLFYSIILVISVVLIYRASDAWKQRHESSDLSVIVKTTTKPPPPNKKTTTPPSDKKDSKTGDKEQTSKTSSTKSKTLPNALIIGAEHCGTRPLAAFLSQHEHIAVSSRDSRFFSENYDKGVDWYSSNFEPRGTDQLVSLERSPSYFYSQPAAERVKKLDPDMKIIVIFRNPVKRLISNFTTSIVPKLKSDEDIDKVFQRMVIEAESKLTNVEDAGVKKSIYSIYLKRWIDAFSREQVHVINGDEFIKNPMRILRGVETFLGVPHELAEDNMQFNSTSGYFCVRTDAKPRCYGHVDSWEHQSQTDFNVLQRVKNFYRHHNDKLFDLIGERFEWS